MSAIGQFHGGSVAGLVLFVVIVAVIVIFAVTIRNNQRRAYEQASTADPVDPFLDEVFLRPSDTGWKRLQSAEAAIRAATPHIWRVATGIGATPVLIVHSNNFVHSGLLVVTSDQCLLFRDGKMSEVAHRSGVTTRISGSPNGMNMSVEISSQSGSFEFSCESLEQAQLICGAIDNWVEHPEVRNDPRVLITPRRVHIPDDFFVDTLRAAGHQVTATNMRSVHERFGMMLMTNARKKIDQKFGLAAGEHFTERYGRPQDSGLPRWAATVLTKWIELDPTIGYTLAPMLPHQIRSILLSTADSGGYFAHPGRPLAMWKGGDWYEDDGRGARRQVGPGGALPA